MEENSFDDPKNIELRDAFVQLETALHRLNDIVPDDAKMSELDWIFDGTAFAVKSPFLMSQFIMQSMTHGTGDCETFFTDEKVFWMNVADEMGPDWIAKFKRVAAFMDKMYEF